MKSLASWLSIMFLGLFWIFRIAVTLATQYGMDFGGFIVFDNTIEIILLFVSLLCFVLIAKRKIWGPIIYLVGYGWYFGTYLINEFFPAITSSEQPADPIIIQNAFVIILGLLLGFVTFLNIAYERTKLKHFTDNKTDWYFQNDKYDRKLDERADKNQYRTY